MSNENKLTYKEATVSKIKAALALKGIEYSQDATRSELWQLYGASHKEPIANSNIVSDVLPAKEATVGLAAEPVDASLIVDPKILDNDSRIDSLPAAPESSNASLANPGIAKHMDIAANVATVLEDLGGIQSRAQILAYLKSGNATHLTYTNIVAIEQFIKRCKAQVHFKPETQGVLCEALLVVLAMWNNNPELATEHYAELLQCLRAKHALISKSTSAYWTKNKFKWMEIIHDDN